MPRSNPNLNNNPKKKPGPKTSGSTDKKYKRADRHKKRTDRNADTSGIEFQGNVPSCGQLKVLFSDEKKAIEYMRKHGLIDVVEQCVRCSSAVKTDWKQHNVRCQKPRRQYDTIPNSCEWCNQPMLKLEPGADPLNSTHHCSNKEECGWTWKSGQCFNGCFFRGSLFYQAQVPANEVLQCLWLWLLRIPVSQAAQMLGWDPKTAGRWFKHLRQCVVEMLLSQGYCDSQVGGTDANGRPIIVELDESKFAKRKYNRGRKVSGDWVLGMVERTKERRMVLIVVPDRTRDTLEPIIQRFVAPGSVIHSDMWKAYDHLADSEEHNYKHERLCHKYEFVIRTGIHTQTIESNWRAVKATIPLQKRTGHDLQEYLFEFMWRRQNHGNLWNGLLEGLSRIRHTPTMLRRFQEELDIKCEDEDDAWELPRNCRPRDVNFQLDDYDYDYMGDQEMVASGVLSALLEEAGAAPEWEIDTSRTGYL